MSDTLHRLRIFVSCPDELDSQKPIVEGVSRELSALLEDTTGLTLKVVNWKSDVVPGIASDPQARINDHIRYDIYIGLLGTRFGTPTARAGSGTEDEFLAAYQRYAENTRAVRLLFYFKRNLDDVFTIDPEQLRKVQAFQQRLKDLGVLYGSYSSATEFQDFLRAHLSQLLNREWDPKSASWTEGSVPAASLPPAVAPEPAARCSTEDVQDAAATGEITSEDLPGTLDYAVELEESAAAGTAAMARLFGSSDPIQAGEFEIPKGMGGAAILEIGRASCRERV